MYNITHIMWSKKSIGIATNKMKEEDVYMVSVKGCDGKRYFPGKYRWNKKDYIERYGPEEIINKKSLVGVWVPLIDLPSWRINKQKKT